MIIILPFVCVCVRVCMCEREGMCVCVCVCVCVKGAACIRRTKPWSPWKQNIHFFFLFTSCLFSTFFIWTYYCVGVEVSEFACTCVCVRVCVCPTAFKFTSWSVLANRWPGTYVKLNTGFLSTPGSTFFLWTDSVVTMAPSSIWCSISLSLSVSLSLYLSYHFIQWYFGYFPVMWFI